MKLYFTVSDIVSATKFSEGINRLGFHAEFEPQYGRFAFEEQEDLIDELEMALTNICDEYNVNGYFEAEC